jgi:capsular polysaccharide biosynthesis protein
MIESFNSDQLAAWLPQDAITEPVITKHQKLVYFTDSYVYQADGSLHSALTMDRSGEDYIQKSSQDVVSNLNLDSDQHIFAIAANRWANNYYHWVSQGMASWAVLIDHHKRTKASQRLILLAPAIFKNFHFQWLGILGGDHLTLPRKYSVTTGVCLTTSSSHSNPSRTSIQRLRQLTSTSLNAWLRNSEKTILEGLPTELQKIYISRGSSGARAIGNEGALEDHMKRLGFTIISAENYTVLQQIYIFSKARVIVAFHGAGLTNLIFSDPACHVIELVIRDKHNDCFKRLSALLPTRRYSKLLVEPRAITSTSASVLEADLRSIAQSLEPLLEESLA